MEKNDTMLIALSVGGFDKVLREDDGWSKCQVEPSTCIAKGWRFMRRQDSNM